MLNLKGSGGVKIIRPTRRFGFISKGQSRRVDSRTGSQKQNPPSLLTSLQKRRGGETKANREFDGRREIRGAVKRSYD